MKKVYAMGYARSLNNDEVTYLKLLIRGSLKYVISISPEFVLPSGGELPSSPVLAHHFFDH